MTLPHENASQFLVKALTSSDDAVVIWHDPSGDAREAFEDFELEGVEKLDEGDFGTFELKCKLNELSGSRPILLYRRQDRVDTGEEIRRDYLADVEQYAIHYEADLVSELLRELNATDSPAMRRLLNDCKGYLKKRQVGKLQNLRQGYATPNALTVAILAMILGADDVTPYELVISYLSADDETAERAVETMKDAKLLDEFARIVREGTSFPEDVRDRDILTTSILLTALLVSLRSEDLADCDYYLLGSSAQDDSVRSCHRIVTEWAEGPKRSELRKVCGDVAEDENLIPVFEGLGAERLSTVGVFPQIDDIVIRELLEGVNGSLMGQSDVVAILDARKSQLWYAESRERYAAAEWYASFTQLAKDAEASLHFRSVEDAWKRYVEDFSRVDTAYRKCRPLIEALKGHAEDALEDAADSALDLAEKRYARFLDHLAEEWSRVAEDDYADLGYAKGVDRCNGFYMRVVEPLVHAKGCVVIISDALRYEVAAELAALLKADFPGDVELSTMQAMYPSVTATGMAALLPHHTYKLEVKGYGGAQGTSLSVSVDGMDTGSQDREAVLRKAEPGACALKDDVYLDMKAQDRRALRQDSKLIYLYQNVIDAIGDHAPTETQVFGACDDAIARIKRLVDMLKRDRHTNIVITADHGFLYKHDKLTEAEKAEKDALEGEVRWIDKRAVLADGESSSSRLLKVNMHLNGSDELVGFSPRDCSRYKVRGGGSRYVHGGTSLEEVCVPVIRLRRRTKGSRGYEEVEPVQLQPVGLPDVITNNVITLRLLQEEPIGGQRKPGHYEFAFMDADGHPLSERKQVIADKDSPNPKEREFTLEFILSAGSQLRLGDTCYLVETDVDRKGREVRRWPLTYQVAFAPPSDFGW